MTTVKEENGNASFTDHQPNTQNATTYTAYSSTGATARKRKKGRGEESLTQQTRRKSSRRSVAPKTLLEEVSLKSLPRQQATHAGTWKAEELEILLDCLKTHENPDKILKKHVKTKNSKQIELKIEALKKKAVDKALEETTGMPPLQCWENLAQDINSTLGDESYREISKVFRTAISEPTADYSGHDKEASQPNYTRINLFMATLLRGAAPHELNELTPLDAMVVLECLNNTIELLQNIDTNEHVSFLRKRYSNLFYNLYVPSSSSSSSASSKSADTAGMSGLGTLNPFNIPVDVLNCIRPEPCEEHGDSYCCVLTCRKRNKSVKENT